MNFVFDALLCVFITGFCAIIMRIKGGGIISADADGKVCSALSYCVLIFALSGKGGAALLAGAGWLYVCAPALRDYLTNLGGYKKPLSFFGWGQHRPVVKICDFVADFSGFGKFKFTPLSARLDNARLRRLYGWLGTTIRGFWPSIPLAGILFSPVFIFAGLLMAPVYFAGISWWQYQRTTPETWDDLWDGWSLGEWFWGGVFGAATYIWYKQGTPTIIDFLWQFF